MAVGELFLSAFLQVLFDRLASPDVLRFASQEGVRSKLQKWEEKLKMIQAVLNDAEEKQLTDRAVKIWLDDLRDLAYDVEDMLDEFATEALGRKLKAEHHESSSSSKVRNLIIPAYVKIIQSPSAVKFDFTMRSKIKGITSRLEVICKQRVELGLQVVCGGTSSLGWQRPPSTCLPPEPVVYGREEDKRKILEMVLRDEPRDVNYSVIPIVGMGGIGKTTLAQLVYNDREVEQFKPRAWVCVSDDFDVLRITKAILESTTLSSCDLKDLNQVQVQLNEELVGKKFLIVLDDVWSKNYSLWDILKRPFLAGAPGSKIIVTTRSVDVALTIGPVKYYPLELLSNDDCWSVFMKHAFEGRNIEACQISELIREKVVEKCKGLPLAARTLGGLLRCKHRDEEWEDVLNSKIWDLSEDSDILPVLRLSYHHLPSHLKRCFAYCSIFPKDYQLEEKEVVLLWMAEGLVEQSIDNKQMEDLG
ncbi:putative disease resistance RPP13-like protein 1 [Pistacia vera]|uniref:putative disease resistance RPP13-like protein 1 n=1 Tax=Pistacia vera TaxID=55513 RepID=UPI001263B179|nr:putative disease resistance RPP13-like protein 1 [Pistacia vera]